MKRRNRKVLRMPHFEQGEGNNGHCGPCCLKMIADYFKLKNPKTNKRFSIQSLVQIASCTAEDGTTLPGMKQALRRMGLRHRKIELRSVRNAINDGHPCIMVVAGERGFSWHYVVLHGYDYDYPDGRAIIISDPAGTNYQYCSYFGKFLPFTQTQENWIIEISEKEKASV